MIGYLNFLIEISMISGLTLAYTEFYTPYRVSNRHVCRGCYNDSRIPWDARLCPLHGGTERELECSKSITAARVIAAVECLRRERLQ